MWPPFAIKGPRFVSQVTLRYCNIPFRLNDDSAGSKMPSTPDGQSMPATEVKDFDTSKRRSLRSAPRVDVIRKPGPALDQLAGSQ